MDEPTKVINSRTSKKRPLVWRRRQGVTSGTIFTTYERPSLADNRPVLLPGGAEDTFNLGRLILSIAAAFSHNPRAARYDSLWLAQTVEEQLFIDSVDLTPPTIAQATYTVLRRFDELAAIQYAAKHHLITSVRRRGRPSTTHRLS
ncbi:MAG: hypothetical protein WAS27_02835 [Candidatus Saccharimonadales bacterium]